MTTDPGCLVHESRPGGLEPAAGRGLSLARRVPQEHQWAERYSPGSLPERFREAVVCEQCKWKARSRAGAASVCTE